MKLKINGKEYSFKFGIAFVRELNNVAGAKVKGMSFGMGLSTQLPSLQAYDPSALSNILYAANVTESPRLTQSELDKFLDSDADLETIFDEVNNEVSKANATKLVVKKMQRAK